jgi:hypothetical protein
MVFLQYCQIRTNTLNVVIFFLFFFLTTNEGMLRILTPLS